MFDTVTYSFGSVTYAYDGFGRVSRTDHYPLTTGHDSYVWSDDLSGQASGGRASPQAAMQGAGGVGGLLAAFICESTPYHTSYNDCVMRKAVDYVATQPYSLLGLGGYPFWGCEMLKFNCHDWATAVRKQYRKFYRTPKVRKECCIKPMTLDAFSDEVLLWPR